MSNPAEFTKALKLALVFVWLTYAVCGVGIAYLCVVCVCVCVCVCDGTFVLTCGLLMHEHVYTRAHVHPHVPAHACNMHGCTRVHSHSCILLP